MAKIDLLMNEDFHDYLKALAGESKAYTRRLIDGNESPDYFRGGMDMLKQVLKCPLKLATSEKERELAGALVKRSYDEFEARLLRSYLVPEEE